MGESYVIQMVERWTFLNAQRNPVNGYRVTFYIPALGLTDHIVIAESAYNADNVRSAIEEKLALHSGVLSGL